MGVRVIEGYGTTECAPVVATNSYWKRARGSVGPPLPNVSVRLSSDREILVKGENVSPGYWSDDVATSQAFTPDGWYRTGDLGRIDEMGHLHIEGRLKDLIVLPSGMKVHPEDVEAELRAEPGVRDCVVLGRPDSAGQLSVHAAIISTGDAQGGVKETLREAVVRANRRLAPHQQISGFTVWDAEDFPRTNLMKVKRHEVLAAVFTGVQPRLQRPVLDLQDAEIDPLCRLLSSVSGVPVNEIESDSDLALDLKLDSLDRVELAVSLEQDLGVIIDDGDLAMVQTVGQLKRLIEDGEPSEPSAAMPRWALTRPPRIVRTALQQAVMFPLLRTRCRPFDVEGVDGLVRCASPLLFISNHASHLDSIAILRALPAGLRCRVAVAAAADYFYRSRLLGSAVSLLINAFPFSRRGSVRPSIDYCGELADRGWSMLIFPEGTRSPTGSLQPFQRGIGLLALELGLPVVPVAVFGTHAILPKGKLIAGSGPISVKFGEPIILSADLDRADVLNRLEAAVADLLQSVTRSVLSRAPTAQTESAASSKDA
jgi:long-chain acyl-CoA synthetase